MSDMMMGVLKTRSRSVGGILFRKVLLIECSIETGSPLSTKPVKTYSASREWENFSYLSDKPCCKSSANYRSQSRQSILFYSPVDDVVHVNPAADRIQGRALPVMGRAARVV